MPHARVRDGVAGTYQVAVGRQDTGLRARRGQSRASACGVKIAYKLGTDQAGDAQRAVLSFVGDLALLLLDLGVLWEERLRRACARHVIDFPDAEVLKRVVEDDPHNVVSGVARACGRPSAHVSIQLRWDTNAGNKHIHAVTALTKSHSASKLLGTPTCWRCSSRHSLSMLMNPFRTSSEIPSDSVAGRHNCRDICRAIRARAWAAR